MVEDEKVIKKKITFAIILVIILIVSIIGLTIAYFLAQASGNDFTITSDNLTINFTDGDLINSSDLYPINGDEYLKDGMKKSFSVSKDPSEKKLYAKIDITNINLNEKAQTRTPDLKWALYQDNVKVTTGSFLPVKEDENEINVANNIEITDTTKKFDLYIWLEETNVDQSTLIDGTISGKISVSGTRKKLNTLTSQILGTDMENVITQNPDYTNTSNDKGLYTLSNDNSMTNFGFPVYYYRGEIDNNYVSFGTYTKEVMNKVYDGNNYVNQKVANALDDILWRIVRINEDGTIKLIAENNIGDSDHVWDSRDNSDYNGSDIQTRLNEWYKETFEANTKLDKLVVETEFCNDRQIADSNNYAPEVRLNQKPPKPTLLCSNESDKVRSKIGLISADEIVYAGALYYDTVTSSTTYLDNKTNFWSISLSSNQEAFCFTPSSKRLIYNSAPGEMAAARPVITLKSDTIIVTNSNSDATPGSKDNPYKVVIK